MSKNEKHIKYFTAISIMFIINTSSKSFSQQQVFGDQVWMSKNLNVDKFRDGSQIMHAITIEEWVRAGKEKKPAWCYYKNAPSFSIAHGKLYNFFAVQDPRGICPQGWHVPTYNDWMRLKKYLGGDDYEACSKLMENYGESDLISGNRYINGSYDDAAGGIDFVDGNGALGCLWSSTKGKTNNAWYCEIDYDIGTFLLDEGEKARGMSIRCVKD